MCVLDRGVQEVANKIESLVTKSEQFRPLLQRVHNCYIIREPAAGVVES